MQKSRSHCRGQLVRRAAIGAGDVPAGDAYNQAPDAGGKGTCTILKKLLQHHTHCHHRWTVRRDSESLQAELAAARWAWLGPTLLRAYDGEHADDEGPTPRQEAQIEC